METAHQTQSVPATRQGTQNWDAIRMRYELMHEGLDFLSQVYHVNVEFLTRLSESEGWEQKHLPELTPSSDPDGFIEAIKERGDLIQAYKELALMPLLLEIESSLVLGLQTAIKKAGDCSPKDLKMLVDSYSSLLEKQSLSTGGKSISGKTQVTFNTDFGNGGSGDS